jgi:dephospho-CoA kinase
VLRVGLTGGIGSGKSRVAELFAELGVPVIDTDQLSRQVLAADSPLLVEVLDVFGTDLRRDDGSLDRARLRQRVFADPVARARLESMTHPAILEAMNSRIAKLPPGTAYVVLVIPLLIEAGWCDQVDRIVVVDCPASVRIERIIARDRIDADTARLMVESQATRQDRLQVADDVIDNGSSSTPDKLAERVRMLHDHYVDAGTPIR